VGRAGGHPAGIARGEKRFARPPDVADYFMNVVETALGGN
jgi:hypothetical protein